MIVNFVMDLPEEGISYSILNIFGLNEYGTENYTPLTKYYFFYEVENKSIAILTIMFLYLRI
ncbi:hypothetical protein hrd7_15350 [Leptolinea sp. HRD-7]|nr:hypothetical protein hrd7_15350 [Leptolinea sp. HRD-7]